MDQAFVLRMRMTRIEDGSLDLQIFLLIGVAAECAGVREFAEFVADHVFGAIDINELTPVMHLECEADELGHNRA